MAKVTAVGNSDLQNWRRRKPKLEAWSGIGPLKIELFKDLSR